MRGEGRGERVEDERGEERGEERLLVLFWERQQLLTVCVSVQPSKLPLLVCANSACVAGSVHVHSSDLQQQHWGGKKKEKHNGEKKKHFAPDVGLEPTTLRLRVSCSTD